MDEIEISSWLNIRHLVNLKFLWTEGKKNK